MAMFQMLAEMVGAEEFLRLITFTEFVDLGEMAAACVPVRLGKVLEFHATVTADVGIGDAIRGSKLAVGIVWIVGKDGCGRVKCSFVGVGQRCAGPRVFAEV